MTMKTLTLGAFALIFAAATSAEAVMINSFIGNFDIAFDGATGELTDFNRPNGGNLDPNESRTVSTYELEVGGVSEATLMNPPDALFADLLIPNLGSELTTGALINNAGGTGDPTDFGFDFYTSAGGGTELRLGIDDISYTLVTTGLPGLNFFSFFAEAKVLSQSLPGGFEYLEDVLVSYTATEVMVLPGQNGGVRSVVASGSMTVTGQLVPEPTSLAILSTGLLGLVRRRR